MEKKFKGNVFAVVCLVAGTCVGGGMLALPVATSYSGFIPSLVMMACTCLFMTVTGLLFVEANIWLGPGAHITTMTGALLGRFGKWVAVILYLFIGYLSMIAYASGGGVLISIAIGGVSKGLGALLFSVLFGLIILCGNKVVGRINAILVVGLIVAYLILLFGGLGEVQGLLLARRDWASGVYALPLLLTIFSYQAVVPSLVLYVDGDAKRLRAGIIGGAVMAFLIYALWQMLILGVVPMEGANGLEEAYLQGESATAGFRYWVGQRWISATGEFFAFFAIVTSFLGIGLGLYDFLADGLKISRTGWNRLWITLLIIVPSYVVAVTYSRAFLDALDASGGFGDTILNGVIPALMVISGRYIKKHKGPVLVRGGMAALVVIILAALYVFGVEILERIHFFAPIEIII